MNTISNCDSIFPKVSLHNCRLIACDCFQVKKRRQQKCHLPHARVYMRMKGFDMRADSSLMCVFNTESMCDRPLLESKSEPRVSMYTSISLWRAPYCWERMGKCFQQHSARYQSSHLFKDSLFKLQKEKTSLQIFLQIFQQNRRHVKADLLCGVLMCNQLKLKGKSGSKWKM